MNVFRHYDRKALDAEYNNAEGQDALDWVGGDETVRTRSAWLRAVRHVESHRQFGAARALAAP